MAIGKRLGVIKLSCQRPGVRRNIVLLRGLGRSSAFWLDFPKYLTSDANVIMIDLLGTGASPSFWGRGLISSAAQDVLYTLEQENVEACHLLGISLGGMIAAQAAQMAEERRVPFLSLSLLNSSARFTKQKRISPFALIKILWQVLKIQISHKSFANYLVSQSYLDKYPQLPEIWDGMWRAEKISRVAVIRQLLAAAFFHGEAIYRSLKTKTFFITSQGDRLVTWHNSIVLWQATSRAMIKDYEIFGHDITTECPKTIAEDVLRFVLQSEENAVAFENTPLLIRMS